MKPGLVFSIVALTLLIAAAFCGPLILRADPIAMDFTGRFGPMSASHWLGQDDFGRDVLVRLLHGVRVSLTIAVIATLIAAAIGTVLGLLAGYYKGIAAVLALRGSDVMLCFPPLLVALLVVTIAGPGLTTLIGVLSVVFVPTFVRVVYSGVLGIREQEFVEAMRALGVRSSFIMFRTILPNIIGPLLVQCSIAMATAVLMESGLSFLGLGVPPPESSLGLMVASARMSMYQAPHLLIWPAAALTFIVLVMNALCDGLRDHFDPRPRLRARAIIEPRLSHAADANRDACLLVNDLSVTITNDKAPLYAVRNVSLSICSGEIVALVGESGSGKSLLSLSVMGLLPEGVAARSGSIQIEREEILGLSEGELLKSRGRKLAMIFQDPSSSLNPVKKIGFQLAEALQAHAKMTRKQVSHAVVDLLSSVGIADPARRARVYPHEMSGGMKQRVMIAIALANQPKLLIADEPTTALDVTIQAQVLDLIRKRRDEGDLAILFVTHSLGVVREIADRVMVMYAGEILEEGPVGDVFHKPKHPYTMALLKSYPKEFGPAPVGIPGSVPPPHHLPPGCSFAPRCPLCLPDCERQRPSLVSIEVDRKTRCIRWEEL
ncbi:MULTISPECIES: dipeptide/oligopeptide/nickel ABC transporter permease/ATP-binding protein [Rhizobium/Agrobacterium group]|uniref:dipeptide/oligopeptide/nickel ABC transporter permease/ATP-binding protein n=1 Tax=Rhizobium/Agrobacterium group TaxID=227290 RepID=UPI0008FB87BA|nr:MULTISPECIES: dipeptide/oligopeptide/nickel ABC transporter permease/ATP-binding protein [Rhizobium/Agrobacterium group]MCF1465011.1 dipeptide/oligopeptide/nickel ABC transporter permease/ATP-binding protein [Allorhizobium ampelinum]MCF1496163.1 dipeptide/oligopeptide/nickel ABC transporter permease/ATP-binding protein [Allorhizobium ampelinum]MUZ55353.1 ATP-binding cassette domain-containing protein [Agrobacterium vitis]MUZ94636.1 ATP-binding cassette domain-containing protein [Agrobacteriu